MSITIAKITILLSLLAIWGIIKLDRFLTKRHNLRRKTKFYKSEEQAARASKAWNYFTLEVKKGTMLYDRKNGIFVEYIKAHPNPIKSKGYIAIVKPYGSNKRYHANILDVEVATTLDYMRVKKHKKDNNA